jgi:hypothetical protein
MGLDRFTWTAIADRSASEATIRGRPRYLMGRRIGAVLADHSRGLVCHQGGGGSSRQLRLPHNPLALNALPPGELEVDVLKMLAGDHSGECSAAWEIRADGVDEGVRVDLRAGHRAAIDDDVDPMADHAL